MAVCLTELSVTFEMMVIFHLSNLAFPFARVTILFLVFYFLDVCSPQSVHDDAFQQTQENDCEAHH